MKTRKAVTGAMASAALALSLCLAGCGSVNVSEEQVREDVASSAIVSEGLISSRYVDDAPYELTDLRVVNQSKLDDSGNTVLVEFSGVISNGYLESSFQGNMSYSKSGDSWTAQTPKCTSVETTPLQGVAFITDPDSLAGNGSITSFESTFVSENEGYSSVATQVVALDEWFATDMLTSEQSFVFDPERGWIADGDQTTTAVETTWKLAGKTFECATVPSIYSNQGDVNYTITLGEVAEDGTLSASYTIDYEPGGDRWSMVGSLYGAHIAGEASGKIVHEAGSGLFTIELSDPSNNVTFVCESAEETLSAGSGTVNAMRVNVVSDILYCTDGYSTLNRSDVFTEKLS